MKFHHVTVLSCEVNQVVLLAAVSNYRNLEASRSTNSSFELSMFQKKKKTNHLFIPNPEKSPWIVQKDALYSFIVSGVITTSATRIFRQQEFILAFDGPWTLTLAGGYIVLKDRAEL